MLDDDSHAKTFQNAVHSKIQADVLHCVHITAPAVGSAKNAEWITSKVVSWLYKAVADSNLLLASSWQDVCEKLVTKFMHGGFHASCEDENPTKSWYFSLDLTHVMCNAACELLCGRGQALMTNIDHCPGSRDVREKIAQVYNDIKDEAFLQKAIWESMKVVFHGYDDRVQKKLYLAFWKTYWPAFEETIKGLGPQRLKARTEQLEIANVQIFVERWMEDAFGRAWGCLNDPEEAFTTDVITDVFRTFLAPFGRNHPYSCMPTALIEAAGHPPPDWPFIESAAEKFNSKWAAKSRKKRRRIEEVVEVARTEPTAKVQRVGQRGGPVAKGNVRSSSAEQSQSMSKGTVSRSTAAIAKCLAGSRHPQCTSEGDCIGSSMSRLVRHLVSAKTLGDTYCEPCWCTFVRRNPKLNGVFIDD